MEVKDLKNKSLDVIQHCTNPDEIKGVVDEINKFYKQPWLNEDNYSFFDSMICKLQIKRFLIMYYESGYSQVVYDKLVDCFLAIEKLAERKKYEGTYAYAHNYRLIIEKVHPLLIDIHAVTNSMMDSFGNRILKSERDYLLIVENLNNRINTVNNIEKGELFPKSVNVDSPIDVCIKELTQLKEKAESIIVSIKNERDEAFLKHHTKNIKDVEKIVYEFYPELKIEENRYSKALILNSPFIEEIRLFVNSYLSSKKEECVIINAKSLESMDEIDIRGVFELFKTRNFNLLIEGLGGFNNTNTIPYLFESIMGYAKLGHYVFMEDNVGDNGLYKEFIDICKKEDNTYTIMDISSTYVSMPSFNDLVQLLVQEKVIPDNSVEYTSKIKEKLPFMGFRGLNEIFIAVTSGTDWIKKAEKISKSNRTRKLDEYLKKIPTQSLLIDTFWGDFTDGSVQVGGDKPKFDYDSVRLVNPNNIRKIIESDLSLFEKCGLVCRYCLLSGDDVSSWVKLERDEQERRLEEATRIVFKLLGVFDIVPEVVIVDKIEGQTDTTIGVCIGGGKRIEYQYKAAQEFSTVLETICHESFHAFQHNVMRLPYSRWLWTELGIMPGRIEQWRLNNSCYVRSSTENYNYYRYQIFESDAFAFEQDCAEASGKVLNLIDFE